MRSSSNSSRVLLSSFFPLNIDEIFAPSLPNIKNPLIIFEFHIILVVKSIYFKEKLR